MDNLDKNNNNNSASTGRVIWVDPNLSNNRMVNTEDLSIKVEFSATKKDRSVIFSGNRTEQTVGDSSLVTFIEGSKVNNESKQPSLTTRYTDVISLDVMSSDNNKPVDDFESLGIESIDIEFNTAFAPLVKIKFIDVRGNAILSQGNMSKYRMFFELPYPIFSLKVKGFYGKTVNYCLHMQRWNAAFNSDTGNFEIQAEFIGYTYALLTDMLIGLIRASVRTKRGQLKLAEKQQEYGQNSNLIISIDEMLSRLNELNYTYQKTNEDDDSVQQVNAYDKIEPELNNIKTQLDNTVNSIYDGQNPPNNFFKTENFGIVAIPNNAENIKKVDDIIKTYLETIKKSVADINVNISDNDLKLSESELTFIATFTDVTYSDLTNSNETEVIKKLISKSNKYNTGDEDRVRYILNEIKKSLNTSINGNTTMNIYSFYLPYSSINKRFEILKTNKDKTVDRIVSESANQATEIVGFEPTIRNIFRVLTVNTEIFLEVLKQVSVEAQNSADRTTEFKKISGKINVNQKQIDDGVIFPWPEYRQKKDNEGYVETWLGSAPGIVPSKIPEVVFTEELHKELLNVAKFDKELDNEQGVDIDAEVEEIKDPWYPVSVADTPPSGINENPYKSIINGDKVNVDEVIRLLLMRGFLAFGVSAYKSKTEFPLLLGRLEASNLYEVAKKTENGLNIIKQLQNLYGKTDSKVQKNELIKNNGEKGSKNIKNPGVAEGEEKPILRLVGDNYQYIYIGNDKKSYIPIGGNYDGSEFYYNDNKLKADKDLNKITDSVIFVSNEINKTNNDKPKDGYYPENGSTIFNIIDRNTYISKVMAPTFGTTIIEEDYVAKGLDKGFIQPNTFIDAYTIESKDKYLNNLNPLIGQYKAQEINVLDYSAYKNQDKSKGLIGEGYTKIENQIAPSITAFYIQRNDGKFRPYGAYLCAPMSKEYYDNKMPKNTGEKFDIYSYQRATLVSDIKDLTNNYEFGRVNNRYGKQKDLIEEYLLNTTKPYVPYIDFGFSKSRGNNYTFSLFGSKFYNYQNIKEAKALLFLHCFPFTGVIIPEYKNYSYSMLDTALEKGDPASSNLTNRDTLLMTIKSMFKTNAAFVSAPKSWVLFIGGILWRMAYYKENIKDPIIWNNNNNQYPRLIPGYGPQNDDRQPNSDEFLYLMERTWENWGMFFGNGSFESGSEAELLTTTVFRYNQIDNTILGLPNSIKNKLIKYFKDWVSDSVSGFDYFQNELEIWYGRDRGHSIDKYENKWTNLSGRLSLLNNQANWVCNTNDVVEILNDNENILKNYCMVTPAYDNNLSTKGANYQFQLELRPNTEVMNNIVTLLTEPVYLQNITPYSWIPYETKLFKLPGEGDKNPLYANKILMDRFIESFFEEINKATPNNETTENDQIEQEVFGTGDDKTIRLLIYRTLSSINDKWINGSDDGSVFTQCGNNQNSKDKELASKYRSNTDKPELIDTFRFVDRAFWDIGDKFYLNINAISDMIRHNYNQSFFDIVNKILTDNNFNFIPLPTFINFNNKEELETVFTPYSYNDKVDFDGTGPSFVCVFVGQSSTNLDLGTDSVYPDDGLSLSMGESGEGLNLIDEKEDFSKELEPGEFNVPVFSINYGQQNQNYFKNVRLDQREFTETMESLQIIEDISQNGDKSKPTYAGNNLFNIYQTRSYSAEVEMLGSAMIQPMMYFQLNNIPMFRGAYLIYKVNHNIKPHSMITTIKGNRVKKSKTPLIDKATMYMNLVGGSSAGTSGIRSSGPQGGFVAKYYADLIANLPDNKTIEGSIIPDRPKLQKTAEEEIKKWQNGKLDEKDGVDYLNEYAKVTPGSSGSQYSNNSAPWSAVFTSYIMFSGDPDFPKSPLHYDYITAAINGKKGYELFPLQAGLKIKAGVGDLLCAKRSGGYTESHCDVIYKVDVNNNIAYIVGGNLSDSIGLKEKKLNDGYFIDSSDINEYRLYIKKTGNKYYKGKKIVGTGNYYEAGSTESASEVETRKTMKVDKLQKGFIEVKAIIKNGNYNGANINNWESNWITIAANYIAKKEASSAFKAIPKLDQGTFRGGYGTSKILENGQLVRVKESTRFTLQSSNNTLVYQIKNMGTTIEKDLGTANWNKLNDYQKAAIVSLGYNVGENFISDENRLYAQKIKKGISDNDYNTAAQGILDGPITGAQDKKVYSGLVTRRKEEARLFLLPKTTKIVFN
jgi:GH24 family phage-related lysozyme (muramidase)